MKCIESVKEKCEKKNKAILVIDFLSNYMSKNTKLIILLLLIIGCAMFLRVWHLEADPPTDLSRSSGIFMAEGGWVYNARNKVLFDTWQIDNYNKMYLAPIMNYLFFLSFKFIGPGLLSARLVSIVLGLLSFFIFFMIVRKGLGPKAAIYGLILWGVNYLSIVLNRLADPYMGMTFFMLLAVFFFFKGLARRGWYFFFSGAMCLAAYLCVKESFYFSIVLFLSLALISFSRRDFLGFWKKSVFLAAGMGLVYALYWGLVLRGHSAELAPFMGRQLELGLAERIGRMIANIWGEQSANILGQRMPIVCWLVFAYGVLVILQMKRQFLKIRPVEILGIIWVVTGLWYLAATGKTAVKSYLSLVPGLCLLAGAALERLQGMVVLKKVQWQLGWGSFILLIFWLGLPVKDLLIDWFPGIGIADFSGGLAPGLLSLGYLLLGTIIAIALVFLLRAVLGRVTFINKGRNIGKVFSLGLVVVIIVSSAWFNLHEYRDWAKSVRTSLCDISRDWDRAFGPVTMAGLWAPVMSLENRNRAHVSWGNLFNDDPGFFQRCGITHLFCLTFNREKIYYERHYPREIAWSRPVARYNIWKTEAWLMDVSKEHQQTKQGPDWEAELMKHNTGNPCFAEQASAGFALGAQAGKDRAGYLAQSPSIYLEPGSYQAVFRLRAGAGNGAEVGRIAVVSAREQDVLAERTLSIADFSAKDTYIDLLLPFTLPDVSAVELRTFFSGNYDLWLDKIQLKLLESAADPVIREAVVLGEEENKKIIADIYMQQSQKPTTAIVFTHGSVKQGRNEKFYPPLYSLLARKGYLVVAYDLRGYGESLNYAKISDSSELDFLADARTVLAYAKSLPGIKEVVSLGHSCGGDVSFAAGIADEEVRNVIKLSSAYHNYDVEDRGSKMHYLNNKFNNVMAFPLSYEDADRIVNEIMPWPQLPLPEDTRVLMINVEHDHPEQLRRSKKFAESLQVDNYRVVIEDVHHFFNRSQRQAEETDLEKLSELVEIIDLWLRAAPPKDR